MNISAWDDFQHDNWTPAQWERAMMGAYLELKARHVPKPHVTYAEAYDYHLRMVGKWGKSRTVAG